jgi:hypothetical protein
MNMDNEQFPHLIKALNQKDEEAVLGIINISKRVSRYLNGKVTINGGSVFYGPEQVHNVVAQRIVRFMREGIDAQYLINFLENLMKNPSKASREELYLFLENGKVPITDDGRFIAYKWVTSDYKDSHTRRMDNSVGQIVKMDRSGVDDDRSRTCSSGLHVCTQFYTKFSDKLMLVAVNPKDVVSVPVDYNNAKMRVAEYEVLEEISPELYGHIEEKAMAQITPKRPAPTIGGEPIVDPKLLEEVRLDNLMVEYEQTLRDVYEDEDEDEEEVELEITLNAKPQPPAPVKRVTKTAKFNHDVLIGKKSTKALMKKYKMTKKQVETKRGKLRKGN